MKTSELNKRWMKTQQLKQASLEKRVRVGVAHKKERVMRKAFKGIMSFRDRQILFNIGKRSHE